MVIQWDMLHEYVKHVLLQLGKTLQTKTTNPCHDLLLSAKRLSRYAVAGLKTSLQQFHQICMHNLSMHRA